MSQNEKHSRMAFKPSANQRSQAKRGQEHGTRGLGPTLATGGNHDHKVVDIMPAQQSNISAEDLDDDDGRTKEIPRQSVLSNLVESSISNFDNLAGEDGNGDNDHDLDNVVNSKNSIRIDKQGSISTNRAHNNLKSRKS